MHAPSIAATVGIGSAAMRSNSFWPSRMNSSTPFPALAKVLMSAPAMKIPGLAVSKTVPRIVSTWLSIHVRVRSSSARVCASKVFALEPWRSKVMWQIASRSMWRRPLAN